MADGPALCTPTANESGKKLGDVVRRSPATLARETVPIRVRDRRFTLTTEGLTFLND